jgi:hypothetical protein
MHITDTETRPLWDAIHVHMLVPSGKSVVHFPLLSSNEPVESLVYLWINWDAEIH